MTPAWVKLLYVYNVQIPTWEQLYNNWATWYHPVYNYRATMLLNVNLGKTMVQLPNATDIPTCVQLCYNYSTLHDANLGATKIP